VDDIKIRRLRWVGHTIRMEDERIPKKIVDGKLHNTNQWENQEQNGRTSPGGTYHRS
jgi:hypothetical protein